MSEGSGEGPRGQEPQQPQPAPAVDIRQLAEKVYQLMLADARLAQARGEQRPRPKRR